MNIKNAKKDYSFDKEAILQDINLEIKFKNIINTELIYYFLLPKLLSLDVNTVSVVNSIVDKPIEIRNKEENLYSPHYEIGYKRQSIRISQKSIVITLDRKNPKWSIFIPIITQIINELHKYRDGEIFNDISRVSLRDSIIFKDITIFNLMGVVLKINGQEITFTDNNTKSVTTIVHSFRHNNRVIKVKLVDKANVELGAIKNLNGTLIDIQIQSEDYIHKNSCTFINEITEIYKLLNDSVYTILIQEDD